MQKISIKAPQLLLSKNGYGWLFFENWLLETCFLFKDNNKKNGNDGDDNDDEISYCLYSYSFAFIWYSDLGGGAAAAVAFTHLFRLLWLF